MSCSRAAESGGAVLRQVFDDFDTNGDGYLDSREIKARMERLGLPMSAQAVDDFVRNWDSNKDGRISLGEFERFAAIRSAELRDAYEDIRSHSQGEMVEADLRAALHGLGLKASDAAVHKLLRQADANGDGRISFEEFRAFLLFAPGRVPADLFDYWGRCSAIDIGEDMCSVDEYVDGRSAAITLVAGGVAGAVSRTATAPMDRLKTMLQANASGAAGVSIPQGLRAIYRQGGWRAFWVGNGVNVLKIAPETGTKFLCYDLLKRKLCADPTEPTVGERLTVGAMAGAVAQTMIYPLEVAKTRLAVSPAGTYSSIGHCLSHTVAQGGPGALLRGLNASVLGIMPYAGVDLAVYNTLKDNWLVAHPDSEDGPGVATLLGFGALSSTAGQLVAYPLQLVRTRLQSAGMPGMPHYDGMWDCVRHVLRHDGVAGFYRGLGPNFIKSLPAIAISYAVFETVKARLETISRRQNG